MTDPTPPPGQNQPIDATPAEPQEAASGPTQEVLEQKLEELRRTADQYRDQLLRKAAEFENYRRRSEADFANIIRNANESLVSSLLPILDDLARSLKAGGEKKDFDSFFRGIEMISAKLLKTLENQGLNAFDSVGKPFDVAFHDALMLVPRADVPPHTVVEEVERGYKFNERVLRHARVVVSAAPGEDDADA
jgi:molecular chaperone GrpE